MKRNQIILEIKNINASLEQFKNDYSSYPPNAMNAGASPYLGDAQNDLVRAFKSAFPRADQQEIALVSALSGGQSRQSAWSPARNCKAA